MALIRYKGKKPGGMPITFPIGVHNKNKITQTKYANPTVELSDEEAKKLISLDSQNFEILEEGDKMKEVKDPAQEQETKEEATQKQQSDAAVVADEGLGDASAPKKEEDEKDLKKADESKAEVKKNEIPKGLSVQGRLGKEEDLTRQMLAQKVDDVSQESLQGKVAPDGIKPAVLSPKEPNDANKSAVGQVVTSNPGGRRDGIENPMPASVDPTVKQHNAPVENPGRDDARDPNTAATGDPETKEAIKEEVEGADDKEVAQKKRGRPKVSDKKDE